MPADNTRGQNVRLSPLETPKASDILANELRERIFSGEYPEGTALPPERELVTQTRMSRATVREALRILEVQGLVKLRSGRAGGAFVRSPGQESVHNSITLVIRGQKLLMQDLLDTREAIEPACARLAALNRTQADLDHLAEIGDDLEKAIGDREAFLKLNVEWHVAVAAASHNEILSGLMRALQQAIFLSTENPGFVDREVMALSAAAHRKIAEAIRDQDADGAARRMNRHLSAYAEDLNKTQKTQKTRKVRKSTAGAAAAASR